MCEKGVSKCICLEMHLYVQAPFWSAVVAESTVMKQRLGDSIGNELHREVAKSKPKDNSELHGEIAETL
jgi:hypothetical protein